MSESMTTRKGIKTFGSGALAGTPNIESESMTTRKGIKTLLIFLGIEVWDISPNR